MLPKFELVYWQIRGRAYPILLLLKAARVPFVYREAPFERQEWPAQKRKGTLSLQEYPFGALPVLNVREEDDQEWSLAEQSAILQYLEREMQADAASANQQRVEVEPQAQARLDMILSAALHCATRLFMSGSSPTWLVPPERTSLKDDVVLPFLRGLEHQLQDASLPSLVAPADPRGRVHVRAAGCAAVTTVSMISTLFPLSLAHPARTAAAGGGGVGSARPPEDGSTPLAARFPACARLVQAVEGTPGVAKWLESGERKERWSLWPSYAPEEVRRQAEQWDRE